MVWGSRVGGGQDTILKDEHQIDGVQLDQEIGMMCNR